MRATRLDIILKEPETVPAFNSRHQHNVSVDASVRDALKSLAKQRGMSVNTLIRESLHCHLLKRAEPVGVEASKPASMLLTFSPYEEKQLAHWREVKGSSFSAYFSTLAAVSKPLPHADLVAVAPSQAFADLYSVMSGCISNLL